MTALLEARDLRVQHRRQGRIVHALAGVDLTLGAGEVLGVVGGSGCGKSTLAHCLAGLLPHAGEVRVDGQRQRPGSGTVQLVFQAPASALDPLSTVGQAIAEPLICLRRLRIAAERDAEVVQLMGQVGLDPALRTAHPHQLSGGQLQRVCIARALAARPRVLVADEPTSSLDAIVQAEILGLLQRLSQQARLTLVFITHDLRLLPHLCQRVAVMAAGRVIEELPVEALQSVVHPYSRGLLAAATASPGTRAISSAPARGCVFAASCPLLAEKGFPRCVKEVPRLAPPGGSHRVACHLEVLGGRIQAASTEATD